MVAGFTLGQLAEALQATLDGDPARMVTGVAPLEAARPDQISFLIDARHRTAARASRAGAFLAAEGEVDLPGPVLRSRKPQRALITLLGLFHPPAAATPGVHPTAVIAAGARVDPEACVGPLSVVGAGAVIAAGARLIAQVYVGPEARVGEGSVLHPHAVIGERVILGRRVIVHAGAVIGADGFGYIQEGGAHHKIPQVGTVRVEDDVEIGANTTIDRATLGETRIGRGTKIDNLVQVAHNCEIGEDSIVAAQVGIAGSCRLGRGVMLAGQVGLADHVTLGDGVIALGQSGIPADVAAGETVFGYPARPASQARRIVVAEGHLPDLVRRLRALERRLDALEGRAPREGEARRD